MSEFTRESAKKARFEEPTISSHQRRPATAPTFRELAQLRAKNNKPCFSKSKDNDLVNGNACPYIDGNIERSDTNRFAKGQTDELSNGNTCAYVDGNTESIDTNRVVKGKTKGQFDALANHLLDGICYGLSNGISNEVTDGHTVVFKDEEPPEIERTSQYGKLKTGCPTKTFGPLDKGADLEPSDCSEGDSDNSSVCSTLSDELRQLPERGGASLPPAITEQEKAAVKRLKELGIHDQVARCLPQSLGQEFFKPGILRDMVFGGSKPTISSASYLAEMTHDRLQLVTLFHKNMFYLFSHYMLLFFSASTSSLKS